MMNSSYFGMGIIWWVIWIVVLFWIFVLPYNIPFQRYKRDSPLDVLQKRFASGEITNEEYQEKKTIIENSYIK
ncbi:MAG: SHOCT domain-containing protein [Bacteroidales bacterium]|jgi:putative membrane protein|nr:SHOCT domain-containing protein [Bacteroidales bacterium]